MPYKMYGNRIFENSILGLHGARNDPEPDLPTKSEQGHGGKAHTYAQVDLKGFIMAARPTDKARSGVDQPGKLGFYFQIY